MLTIIYYECIICQVFYFININRGENMSRYNLDSLDKTVRKTKEKASKTRKRKYDLARSLGFNAQESIILQFKNELIIKELAEERRLKQLNGGQ